LLRLLANFHVDSFKDTLFLSFKSLLIDQLCFNLGIFALNLIALLRDFQFLFLVVLDLALSFGDLGDLHLFFVVDHNVLSL